MGAAQDSQPITPHLQEFKVKSMLRHSGKVILKICCAAALILGSAAASEACLFPCLWGNCGYNTYYRGYYPAPSYYAAPAYFAPSPCGPGGCRTYYGPTACSACGCSPCSCSPCGTGCGPCRVGCAPCATGCATGNCGVNYAPRNEPTPDPTADENPNRTYAEEPDEAGDMPDDDFGPTRREEPAPMEPDDDPFSRPVLPEESEPEADPDTPAPLDDPTLDGGVTLRIQPIRSRVRAEAQYRLPRIARVRGHRSAPSQPVDEEARVANK